MATPLTLLGFFRNDTGTAEYGAGRLRTDNNGWHMVRKQYGNNLSVYNYAQFSSQAGFNAAVANLDAVPWVPEPFSNVDYTLILNGLNSAIPSSTSTGGAMLAASGGSTDVSPVVNAVAAGNAILANMLTGQTSGGPRATEATLALAAGALRGTLSANVGNWPATQAVSGPVTDAQLRATALPVALPATAATTTLQTTANGLLTDVKGLLGGSLTFTMPTGAATSQNQLISNTSLASIDTKLTTVATKAGQDASNTALAAIQGNTAAGATAAKQDVLAGKQDTANTTLAVVQTNTATGNGYLATLANLAGPQPASAYNLVSLAGNNAKSVRAGATWLLGGTVTNTASAFRYLMLYNLADAPVSASVPNMILCIEPGRTITLPIPAGRYVGFSAGLGIAAGTASALGALSTVVGVVGTSTGLAVGDLVINLSYAN